MQTERFSRGAFVFTRTRGLEPRDPADLHATAVSHGIPETVVPAYAGDRVAFMRAITATSRGLSREGFLLRPIRRTSTEVVYGIVRERQDQDRLDHDHEATVSWSAEGDVRGDHVIAQRVASSFAELRNKVVADDWSSTITAYLEAHDAARMRGDGRVYWVPPQRLDDVRRLGSFLADVGIDVIMCELEPETHAVVEDVARESLFDELEALRDEAAGFDGKQKPSTYTRRLEEYQRLRQRAILYRDALGVGVETATTILAELETKVSSMLDLRKQTTVHRDGTVTGLSTSAETMKPEPVPEPAHEVPTEPAAPKVSPSRAPVSLKFAGATFVLASEDAGVITYTSDDEPARRNVAALESMGIAGRWQQAGPLRISVQNSGPPGAAVSLRIETRGVTLEGAAPALKGWGIEPRQ